ncbi:equilibrative nucleoside transporter 1-like [Ruditapes philippinarum]|uniref:equilibrative nucleoside transporter 1-like n=1 Tax=Ruditapes philippinarum TaxID=129788 RepID=UPI00295BDA4B|nr:equilibrative nucleoside transporter 1-like [Ruditapes philippinarum]XP_060564926.1 equilibrative nucleoside transporter 1-like [Ruditapes philippinarum]XP_060564927.1 equilibrative nucleoside transporter 1-like [Ruditapes philippinarum]
MTSTFHHDTSANYSVNNSEQSGQDENTVKLLSYTPSSDKSPVSKRNGTAHSEMGSPDEKKKFIDTINTTPVKLDPGFDSLDRTVEFTNLEKQHIDDHPPPDRYRMVFFIFLIHGIGILMPWNMFITAKKYFEDYKLNTPTSQDASYRTEFMFYLGIVSQVSNAVISCVNTFFQFGGQQSTRRIAIALFMMVIIFIFTVILAMVNTSSIPFYFFCLTMASASLMNCCAGVYQNSTFGLAAILPMKYTNAIVLGTNLSGVFTSVINILSIAGAPDPKTSAVYYFIVAIVVLLVAFDCYFLLPLTKYYQYFLKSVHGSEPVEEKKMRCGDYLNAFLESCKTYWIVIKKIKLQLFGVWLTFCVSLILFPAIQSNVAMIKEPFTNDNGTEVYRTVLFNEEFEKKGYWVSIFTFLSFNLFAFLGNLTSEYIRWPGPKRVWIPIVLRALVLIPIYVFCNYQPFGVERRFPVLIPNDIVFILAGIIMAFTSGYYSSLTMMYGPKEVEPAMMGKAGMMMAFFLVLGITSGVNLSLVLQRLVTTQPDL